MSMVQAFDFCLFVFVSYKSSIIWNHKTLWHNLSWDFNFWWRWKNETCVNAVTGARGFSFFEKVWNRRENHQNGGKLPKCDWSWMSHLNDSRVSSVWPFVQEGVESKHVRSRASPRKTLLQLIINQYSLMTAYCPLKASLSCHKIRRHSHLAQTHLSAGESCPGCCWPNLPCSLLTMY